MNELLNVTDYSIDPGGSPSMGQLTHQDIDKGCFGNISKNKTSLRIWPGTYISLRPMLP